MTRRRCSRLLSLVLAILVLIPLGTASAVPPQLRLNSPGPYVPYRSDPEQVEPYRVMDPYRQGLDDPAFIAYERSPRPTAEPVSNPSPVWPDRVTTDPVSPPRGSEASGPAAVTTVSPVVHHAAPVAGSELITAAEAELPYAGFELLLTSDTFPVGGTASTAATLTFEGSPVAGATLSIPEVGVQAVTGPDGTTSISFPAPASNRQLWIRVTTPDQRLQQTGLRELFILQPGFAALLVGQVTGPTGARLTNYEANLFYGGGTSGRYSTPLGTVSYIVPAGGAHVEISSGAGDLYITHPVTLEPGRNQIHPSASNAVPLSVSASVDGQPLPGSFNLHNQSLPRPSFPHTFHSPVYVTPGAYDIAFLGQQNDTPVLLVETGVSALEAASVTIEATAPDLATAAFAMIDGNGTTQAPHIILELPTLQVVLNAATTLLAEAALSPRVMRYGWYRQTTEGVSWSYGFYPDMPVSLTAGQTTTLDLGGPLQFWLDGPESAQPGQTITLHPTLATGSGHRLDVFANSVSPTGSLELLDADGNSLASSTFPVTWGQATLTMPTHGGQYRLRATASAGPWQTAQVVSERKILVGEPASSHAYHFSLSDEVLTPGETALITATLTDNGQPVAGAGVEVGWSARYGSYVTGADGSVTFSFTAPDWAEAVPVHVETGSVYARLGYLFSVPQNYGILKLDPIRDQNGQRSPRVFVAASTYWPQGGHDMHSGGMSPHDMFGSVRPAGLTNLEIAAENNDGSSLFLYQRLTVEAGQTYQLSPTGAGTYPLTVDARLDTAPVAGSLYLHNEAMTEGMSRYTMGLHGTTYVTPGTYSLAFVSADAAAILSTTGVHVAGPTTTPLHAYSDGLAVLDTRAQDGSGAAASLEWAALLAGQIAVSLPADGFFKATPGVAYAVDEYRLRTRLDDGLPNPTWRYDFNGWGHTPRSSPVPGETADLRLGGPVSLTINYVPGTLQTGKTDRFEFSLRTSGGHQLFPWPSGSVAPGLSATVTDQQGNVIHSFTASWPNSTFSVPTMEAGTYTVTASTDAGPYQGSLTGTATVIRSDAAPAITVTPAVLPVSQSAEVTVRVTRNGQPAVSAPVVVGYGRYTGTTDAAGEVKLFITEHSPEILPVITFGSDGREYGANLFILAPWSAAVQVTGSDLAGQPFREYTATAENTRGGHTRHARNIPAAFLLEPGPAFVQLIREGTDAYYLQANADLVGGQLTPIHLEGSQTVASVVSVELDSAPLTGAWLSLRPSASRQLGLDRGLWLGETGTGTVHYLPGTYDLLVRADNAGATSIAATKAGQSLTGDPLNLAYSTAGLGRLQFTTTRQNTPQDVEVALNTGKFWAWFDNPATVLVTPGSYRPESLMLTLTDDQSRDWHYYLDQTDRTVYSLTAGQTHSFAWDLALDAPSVWLNRTLYTPDSEVLYGLQLRTVSGWQVGWATDSDWRPLFTLAARVTDAAGTQVYGSAGLTLGTYRFQVPMAPSRTYTFHVSGDLGALGTHSASAMAQQAQETLLYVDREVLPVGVPTQVKVRLVQNGLPLAYRWVGLESEGAEPVWKRTDRHGQAILSVTAPRSGTWTVWGNGGSPDQPWLSTRLYALSPGQGLLDVQPLDHSGKPLTEYVFTSLSGQVSGGRREGWQAKAIVPAGLQTVVVRGSAANGDLYYLTTEVTVSEQQSVTPVVEGRFSIPIDLIVTGAPEAQYRRIALQNTWLPYTEEHNFDLISGRVWLSGGPYEGILAVKEPGQKRILPIKPLRPDGTITALTLDLSAATGQLAVTATEATQTVAADYIGVRIGVGKVAYGLSLIPGEAVYVAPGTYLLTGSYLEFANLKTDEVWEYWFEGKSKSLTVTAGSTTPVTLGGPLTVRVNPEGRLFAAGGQGELHAYAQDANGHALVSVTGSMPTGVRTEPGHLLITGPGAYQASLSLWGPSAWWKAPLATGTYSLQFTRFTGPYGEPVQGSGSVMVIRNR